MEISACSAKRQFSSRLLAAHSENFFSFSGAILPFFKRQNRAFQGSAERSIRRSKAAYERLRRPYNPLSAVKFSKIWKNSTFILNSKNREYLKSFFTGQNYA